MSSALLFGERQLVHMQCVLLSFFSIMHRKAVTIQICLHSESSHIEVTAATTTTTKKTPLFLKKTGA